MPEFTIAGGRCWPENLRKYLTTACFTDEPDESRSFNGHKLASWDSLDRFTAKSRRAAQADINEFLVEAAMHGLTDELQNDWASDLWYTRNGHGCGFWDGDYPDGVGEKLSDIACKLDERRIEHWKGRLHYT